MIGKSGNLWYWMALAVAIGSNIAANLALKIAMSSVTDDSGRSVVWQVLSQASFWIGVLFAGLLLASYLTALRNVPVSIAYVAVTSLAAAGLVIAESRLFGIPLGLTRIAGLCLVIAGVALMMKDMK